MNSPVGQWVHQGRIATLAGGRKCSCSVPRSLGLVREVKTCTPPNGSATGPSTLLGNATSLHTPEAFSVLCLKNRHAQAKTQAFAFFHMFHSSMILVNVGYLNGVP